MKHPITATALRKKPTGHPKVAPTWPSYTGTSQLVGASPSGKVTVYVDPTLGTPARRMPRTWSRTPIAS